MARIKTCAVYAVTAAVLVCAGQGYAASRAVSAVATYTKGKVLVQPAGSKAWNDVRMGQFIYAGDTLRTAAGSRAGITYTGGIENRLNANTTIKIEPAELANKGAGSKMQMIFGRVWTKILRKGAKFQIHTPVAVCSVRGTEYETGVEQNGRTDVKVYEGVVEFSNQYGSQNLNKNSKSSCDAGSPPGNPEPLGGNEKETWQDEMNTSGSLQIALGGGEIEVGKIVEAKVTVLDKKGKKDAAYAKKITLSSDNAYLGFALPGTEAWAQKLEQAPTAGEVAFRIKISKAPGGGPAHITAAGETLGASMVNVNVKLPPAKNLRVRVKAADGKEKELMLKFKPK